MRATPAGGLWSHSWSAEYNELLQRHDHANLAVTRRRYLGGQRDTSRVEQRDGDLPSSRRRHGATRSLQLVLEQQLGGAKRHVTVDAGQDSRRVVGRRFGAALSAIHEYFAAGSVDSVGAGVRWVTERYFMLGSLGRSSDEKPRAN